MDPRRVRGGPWAPPPRLSFFSRSLTLLWCFGFSFFLDCGFILCSHSEAQMSVRFHLPFKTRPLVSIFWASLIFLLVWLFLFAFVVLFFLSRHWGNTSLFVVCVSPSDSSSWTSSSPSTRTPSSSTSSRSPPAPSFPLSFRWWWVSVCLGCPGPLSLSLSLSMFLRSFCTECMHLLLRERGGGLQDGAPNNHYDGLGLGNEHGAVSRVQNCPCSPTSSRSPLKQRPEEEVREQPYCHANVCSFMADCTVTQMFGAIPLCAKGKRCCFCGLVLVLCPFLVEFPCS